MTKRLQKQRALPPETLPLPRGWEGLAFLTGSQDIPEVYLRSQEAEGTESHTTPEESVTGLLQGD